MFLIYLNICFSPFWLNGWWFISSSSLSVHSACGRVWKSAEWWCWGKAQGCSQGAKEVLVAERIRRRWLNEMTRELNLSAHKRTQRQFKIYLGIRRIRYCSGYPTKDSFTYSRTIAEFSSCSSLEKSDGGGREQKKVQSYCPNNMIFFRNFGAVQLWSLLHNFVTRPYNIIRAVSSIRT